MWKNPPFLPLLSLLALEPVVVVVVCVFVVYMVVVLLYKEEWELCVEHHNMITTPLIYTKLKWGLSQKNRGLLLTALLTKAFQPPFLFQNQTTLRENAFILYVLVCMCVCYGMTERERHTHTKKRICCYHHYRYVASSGEKEQTSNNT